MDKKLRVAVLAGGQSAEHEVSLLSARNVIAAMNQDRMDILVIGIEKSGQWKLHDSLDFLLDPQDPKRVRLKPEGLPVTLPPGIPELVSLVNGQRLGPVDVAFPVLHGPMGEDGTVQGLLKLAGVPFVGAGILGSAVGMDKDVMKRLLRDSGIPIPRFLVFEDEADALTQCFQIEQELALPVFVKPANLGSSVGISKAKDILELKGAIQEAFRYDRKILVEEAIEGHEIECSVLGNEDPIASVPGEIVPTHEFYSYDAKYIDDEGARLCVPAQLSPETQRKVQDLAVQSFKALACEGLARVDFFVKKRNGDVLVNEINTLPGFTRISMYPRLWAESGVSYSELVERLIQLALERFEKESRLKTCS